MENILKKYFGYEKFRPLQKEIIEQVLLGKDCVILMSTGGGKSLCFQLPALLLDGITIVISPLISLMKDQVDALRANGIEADLINSALSQAEIADVVNRAKNGKLKILYLAPERLSVFGFENFLRTLKINLIAIDEAHCISEWGHDFRPDYRNLKMLRKKFSEIPIIALTATATEKVRDDIAKQLDLKNPKIFISSFNRPNLSYEILPKKDSLKSILAILDNYKNESVIIYCFSRNDTEIMVNNLNKHGFKATAYHAGLDSKKRKESQEQFIKDEINIMVATIAFGMGINKPDVRLIIHHSLPKSIEGYYQETGRAGRDGLPARCVLFFSYADKFKHDYFIRNITNETEQKKTQKNLECVMQYGNFRGCRRQFLLHYFNEEYKQINCENCDGCVAQAPISQATTHFYEENIEIASLRQSFSEANPLRQGFSEASKKPSIYKSVEKNNYDAALFEELRKIRTQEASKLKVPPYIIFGDKALREMATYFPQTPTAFLEINGVGNKKLSQFGEQFMSIIRNYAEARKIQEK